MATGKLSSLDFRLALAQFATGVTVVTVEREPGRVHGMTANSFTSVSLDPLLILVCVDARAKLLPLLQQKRRFGVSILKDGQQDISEFFARGEVPETEEARLGICYRYTPDGIPLIEGTLCHLACTLAGEHVAGDHTVCLGKVEFAEVFPGQPLIFLGGEYRRIARRS